MVEKLRESDRLVSSDGSLVRVLSITPRNSVDRFMVLLQTDCSSVPLTTNHRIVVPRGGSQQTIPARHLGLGDDVLCADGVQILTGVEHFYGDDDIYEIVLEPDANMGTFFFTDHQTGTLLTRGKRWHANANRRGNMKKTERSNPGDTASES